MGGRLSSVAWHGFVVIASDSPRVTPNLMRQGLRWLIEENEGAGELRGHIAPECAVALGHSLGGGEALGPTIAWLRFWMYGDPSARDYFFGPDCVLWRAPWTDLQRRNGDWD